MELINPHKVISISTNKMQKALGWYELPYKKIRFGADQQKGFYNFGDYEGEELPNNLIKGDNGLIYHKPECVIYLDGNLKSTRRFKTYQECKEFAEEIKLLVYDAIGVNLIDIE